MTRSEELFGLASQYCETHNDWADDDNSPHPTISYWRAFDSMVDAFSGGDIPANCRRLATAVFTLAQEYESHSMTGNAMPGERFWAARQHLEDTLISLGSPQQQVYRESVEELHSQKVPAEQIAKIWGLVNSDGTGQAWKIQQELKNPGSVIGEDYVHPDDAEDAKQCEEIREAYQAMASARSERADDDEVCPESSYDLWIQDVTVRQAAQMLKRDEDDVSSEWEKFRQEEEKKKAAEDSGDESSDAEEPFADWDYLQLKMHAKDLGIAKAGNMRRDVLVEEIIAAEKKKAAEQLAAANK